MSATEANNSPANNSSEGYRTSSQHFRSEYQRHGQNIMAGGKDISGNNVIPGTSAASHETRSVASDILRRDRPFIKEDDPDVSLHHGMDK